jgi:hypothetical protein
MRRRGLDGPGMERAREFEERTRVVAERLDVEEIFRTRETEFLFRGGGGEGVVDCVIVIAIVIDYIILLMIE